MDKKKILTVDDDFNITRLLKFKLNKEGFDVFEAHNGEEALKTATSLKPDLILLDIMMPKMTGWEVNKKLREDSKLKNIPVIMVTAVSQLNEQLKSLKAEGVRDYITKPFNFSELINTVNRVLSQTKENSLSSLNIDP